MQLSGFNLARIRAHNRGTVMHLLHQSGALSRREIAHRTGLDASTITHIIADFMRAGLVREGNVLRANGKRVRGRREIAVELVPDGAFAIGVHVSLEVLRVALCNLHARVIARREVARDRTEPPEATLRRIARLVEEVLDESGVDRARVTGVGVGAIAFVDPSTGVVQSAPSLGWDEVAVTEPLSTALGLPVVLDHHVRAMALAEQWFGVARQVQNFALIRVDTSIGFGLVIDGRLLRGDGWYAGQIAHMIVDDGGVPCTCGRRGCLVTRGSYRAIAGRARELAELHPQSELAQRLAADPTSSPARTVLDLAAAGDPLASSLVDEAAQYIARAITSTVVLLDPKFVVLSTMDATDEPLFLQPIRQYMEAHAPPFRGELPRLIASGLGQDLPVIGAATLALERLVTEPEWYARPLEPPRAVSTK